MAEGDVVTRREILRATEWMLAHQEPIDAQVWETIYDTMRSARSRRTRLMAARLLAERIDPAPRPPVVVNAPTQVNVTWQPPPPSSSPTPHGPSSNGYTIAYDGGTASSPTDDSASP
jgi:hypothetical protein